MSTSKEKELEIFFERGSPKRLSSYDYSQRAWESHEARIVALEEGYVDTVNKLSTLAEEIERNANRFRSVLTTGIVSTSIFVLSIGFLLYIDYLKFEVGVPILAGLIAILMGFLGRWRKNM